MSEKNVTFSVGEGRLHLRKIQKKLVFRSVCTTFSLREKILSLENENKFGFILHFARLFVSLQENLLII